MFKEMIRDMAAELKANAFDPESLNDPVALKTSWRYAKRGGNSFRSHRLVRAGADRMEFKPTTASWVTIGIVFVLGTVPLLMMIFFNLLAGDPPLTPGMFFPSLFCLPLAFVGLIGLISTSKHIVFDKRIKAYWHAHKEPSHSRSAKPSKKFVKFSSIHALQIIGERLKSSNGGSRSGRIRFSFEINLVLKDASRINVVDHADLSAIRREAKTLSAFLSVPVWDSTQK